MTRTTTYYELSGTKIVPPMADDSHDDDNQDVDLHKEHPTREDANAAALALARQLCPQPATSSR